MTPEESFLLVSEGNISGQNLGFVDSKATDLEISVGAQTFELTQSPSLLLSDLEGGTTGAVLWRATLYLARWISSEKSGFWQLGLLKEDAQIVELGCGISGLLALSLSKVLQSGTYLLTDQKYVIKRLEANLDNNKAERTSKGLLKSGLTIKTMPLDWETDEASNVLNALDKNSHGVDLVVACDCVYNDHLIAPFVNTCIDLCLLGSQEKVNRTMILIAQQLRSADVLEAWLEIMMKAFTLFRIPESMLSSDLQYGFVIHLAVLK